MSPVAERMTRKSFDAPYDRGTFDKMRIDFVHLGKLLVSRNVYQPGWRWSQSVGPSRPTNLCPLRHLFYLVSGRLHVVTDDQHEQEFAAGDVGLVPAGHDAWVVGDEPVALIDFGGNKEFFALK